VGAVVVKKFEVKSCGKAHAWCGVCRPEQAVAQRKAKPAPKVHDRPCRNCGTCDACLGVEVGEGLKRCRQCTEVKPLAAFARRADTGGYRNQCMRCRNGTMHPTRCEGCGKQFSRWSDGRTLCGVCRPPLTKPCATCGKEFVGSMDQRRYCSDECRDVQAAEQRRATREALRMECLRAYSGPVPFCSCCGTSVPMFLALDHINGGGGRQRKELGGGGYWTWLRANGFPPGFRVLCHNCNHGRELNGGICPHDELVRDVLTTVPA
jgi:hypothetical protein